jgi:hypothetical protein
MFVEDLDPSKEYPGSEHSESATEGEEADEREQPNKRQAQDIAPLLDIV